MVAVTAVTTKCLSRVAGLQIGERIALVENHALVTFTTNMALSRHLRHLPLIYIPLCHLYSFVPSLVAKSGL